MASITCSCCRLRTFSSFSNFLLSRWLSFPLLVPLLAEPPTILSCLRCNLLPQNGRQLGAQARLLLRSALLPTECQHWRTSYSD